METGVGGSEDEVDGGALRPSEGREGLVGEGWWARMMELIGERTSRHTEGQQRSPFYSANGIEVQSVMSIRGVG